jgi:hypothetical protein
VDELIFVEVLGRAGEVVQRHPVPRLPATLGRAYDNDVILDDPYVAPHHLRLERTESGELALVDLESRNGLFALDPTTRVARAAARPDARYRVGHTQLRIRPRSYAVAAEREDAVRRPWFRRPAPFAGLCAAALACVLLYAFTSTTERIEPLKLAMPAVWVALGLALWASVWAFAGKALAARGNFIAHVTIGLAALVLLVVAVTLGGYAAFAFSSSAIDGGTIAPIAAVLAWALYRHLTLVSRQPRRTLAFAALGIVVGVFGVLSLAEQAGQRDNLARMAFLKEIKSPAVRLVPGASPEAFFAAAKDLKPTVDALRREE